MPTSHPPSIFEEYAENFIRLIFSGGRYVPDYESTEQLLQVVINSTLPAHIAKSIRLLSRIIDQSLINVVCKAWSKSRNPDLEKLIIEKGWVATDPYYVMLQTALKQDKLFQWVSTSYFAKIIVETLDDPDPLIAQRAKVHLYRITEPNMLDAVAKIWLENRSPFLLQFLLSREHYQPNRVPEARVMLALKRNDTSGLDKATLLPWIVAVAQSELPDIAERANHYLRNLPTPALQKALCQLVIEKDLPEAQQAAVEAGYLPKDRTQQALFYFVTEQWSQYDKLDFDQRILRTAYATGDSATRTRLAAKVRKAGRPDYLTAIAGSDYRARTAELTLDEAELLVQILAKNREWAKLWSLVLELPLHWSVAAMRHLIGAKWQPEREAEVELFGQLKQHVNELTITDEATVNKVLAPALLQATARVPGRVNSLAFANHRPVIAIGTGNRRVVVWNMQEGKRETVLGGFAHSVGHVMFTSSDTLICGERSQDVDAPCTLHGWQDGASFVLGSHTGPVTALLARPDDTLISTGRDGLLVTWDVKNRQKLSETMPLVQSWNTYYGTNNGIYGDWIREVAVTRDGSQLALLHDKITLFDPAKNARIVASRIKLPKIMPRAAFTPGGAALLLGRSKGEVQLCAIDAKKGLEDKPTLLLSLTHTGSLQELAVLPQLPIVVTAHADGQIRFYDWPDQNLIGAVKMPGQNLSSLTLSPDGHFMAVGNADATITLWDLRVLELRRLFSLPLASAKAVHMAALNVVQNGGQDLPTGLRSALEYMAIVLKQRFRYDIELAEEPTIQVGEYDIDIELIG